MGYDNFKNKICSRYNSYVNTKNKVRLFKSALDKLALEELPNRDNDSFFQVRDFTNTNNIDINFIYKNIMCYYSEERKALVVGVIAPDWRNGWRNISKDKFVSEQIDFIMHFISQYIYRSYQINLIGAIALAKCTSTDFRGVTLENLKGFSLSNRIKEFKDTIQKHDSKKYLDIIGYLKLINALDPFVNKAIFYYIKFLELDNLGYTEEALTAADNMIDVIFQFIKRHKKLVTMDRKKMSTIVYDEIGLFDTDIKNSIERLYMLRCQFTAHPARLKWWDFYEIYEYELEQIQLSVRRTLVLFLKYECNNRCIDAYPTIWSEWFVKYCDIIYDAVDFNDLP